jgi:hypothetical protein
MSKRHLRTKDRPNIDPWLHYQRMESLREQYEHFKNVFKLTHPPFDIKDPPPSSGKVSVMANVGMAIDDASLLAKIAFFTIYWKKFGYYPEYKTDLSGATVVPPPPTLGEFERQLWESIKTDHNFLHYETTKYLVTEVIKDESIEPIITRVMGYLGESNDHLPITIYLPSSATSYDDCRTDMCMDNVTLFYEDYSYYHGAVFICKTFGFIKHGEGYYHDMKTKTITFGHWIMNHLVKSYKKTLF